MMRSQRRDIRVDSAGMARRAGRVATVVLCILLVPRSWAEGSGASYPPAGSPPPAAPCARANPSLETDFLCRFLTQELWERAGRPEFIDAGGRRWQAWFYGKDGITNQLLVEGRDYLPEHEGWFEALLDLGNFEAQTYDYFWDLLRYAPWSVQFLTAAECRRGERLNPYALASTRFRRAHILGLGWPGLGADPGDPSRAFDPEALPLLSEVAGLAYALEPPLAEQLADGGMLRAEVNAFAAGRGALWPDFARDGGVWEIGRDGAATPIDDLDEAAARLAAHGLLVSNDAMRSWDSGRAMAADIARARGPLLFIYFAQDPLLPVDAAGVYGRRLAYLLEEAVRARAGQTSAIQVISHGRSAGVVARISAGRGVVHRSYAPATSPLDGAEFTQALRRAIAEGRIEILTPPSPVAVEGGGAVPVCF